MTTLSAPSCAQPEKPYGVHRGVAAAKLRRREIRFASIGSRGAEDIVHVERIVHVSERILPLKADFTRIHFGNSSSKLERMLLTSVWRITPDPIEGSPPPWSAVASRALFASVVPAAVSTSRCAAKPSFWQPELLVFRRGKTRPRSFAARETVAAGALSRRKSGEGLPKTTVCRTSGGGNATGHPASNRCLDR